MQLYSLVEIGVVNAIYCSGLANVELIDSEVHCTFYQMQRAEPAEDAPIVRAVCLRLILNRQAAYEGMRTAAIALGIPILTDKHA